MRADAPTTTLGWMMVRAPTEAPAPMVTNGPIATCWPMLASAAIEVSGSIPAGGVDGGANSDTARANAVYGSSARSTAHAEGGAAPLAAPRITADARVDARSGR